MLFERYQWVGLERGGRIQDANQTQRLCMLGLNDRHSSVYLPTDFYNQAHLAPVDLCHPNRRRHHLDRLGCGPSHRRGWRLCQNLLSEMLSLNDRHSSLFLPTDFYNHTHLAPNPLRHRPIRHPYRGRRCLFIEHVRDNQDSGIPTVRCERHYSTFFMLPCPLNYSTPLADFPLTTAEPTVWNTPPQRQTLIFISTYRLLQ